MKLQSIGLPMIHNFNGDIRDFTPSIVSYFSKFTDLKVYMEEGYGHRLGFTPQEYHAVNPRVKFVSKEEVFKKDIVIILKCPEYQDLELLKDGSIFFSMLHFDSKPAHVEILSRKKIQAYSMDSIVDDNGIRLFVDYFGTAFAGCKIAFDELSKRMPNYLSPQREELRMTVIGSGGVGQACIKCAEILSDQAFLDLEGVPGLVAQLLNRSVLKEKNIVNKILATTDILVDASKRVDYTKYLISNEQIGYLPEHSVILDISADKYDPGTTPIMIKGLEGIPTGSPSQQVIDVDDVLYQTIPSQVPTENRRLCVSSDAWPAVNPLTSIEYYEVLLKNYLEVLLNPKNIQLSEQSENVFERALYRSTLQYFLDNK